MKRLFLMLCLSGLLTATVASAAELSFNPEVVTVGIGDPITLSLEIGPVNDLLAYSLVFNYDPTIVQPGNAEPGTLLSEALCDHFFWMFPPTGDSLKVDAA